MDESANSPAATPPERSAAEELFAEQLQGLEADEEVDLEALCQAHPEHAEELSRIHSHWEQVTGVFEALDSNTQSFRARLEQRYGERADPGLSLEEIGTPRNARPDSAPSKALSRLEAHAPRESRYGLQDEIARGGMGAILRIWDSDLRRTLAMKVMLRKSDKGSSDTRSVGKSTKGEGSTVEEQRLLGRFLEEAQVTAQLDHPGIVPVHELGLDKEGRVYFTMPLIKGQDLAAILALTSDGDESWSQTRVLNVILKVCEAMAYAHSKKVIHRDLKPANVMAGRFGEVYVMDWGLARVLGRKDSHDLRIKDTDSGLSQVLTDRAAAAAVSSDSPLVTMDGDIVGTPSYMSPEQARGDLENVGPASDVFSIGCILYHLLAGHMPYVPKGSKLNAFAVWGMLQNGPPAPLVQTAPGTPEELVAICEKAMARDVQDRYTDTVEMAEDLRAYLEGRVVQAHRTGPVIEFKKWVLRNKALAAVEVAAVVLVISGLAYLAWFQAESNTALAKKNEELGTLNTTLEKTNQDLFLSTTEVGLKEMELQDKIAENEAATAAANLEKAKARELQGQLARRQHELDSTQAELSDVLLDAQRQAYVANVTAAVLNLEADNFPELLRRLEACPPDLRDWEWDHLRLFESASLLSFEPETTRTLGALFASDGAHVVAVQGSGAIELLDPAGGAKKGELPAVGQAPRSIAVSADGKWLASGHPDGTVHIWNLRTFEEARALPGAENEIGALCFTSDGSRLVAADGYRPVTQLNGVVTFQAPDACPIRVWDPHTGELLTTLEGHKKPIRDLAAHPDGRQVLSASHDGTLCLWDLDQEERVRTYPEAARTSIHCVAFSPDGRHFVSGSDHQLRIWSIEDEKHVRSLLGHDGPVFDVAVSPDGQRVASIGEDRTLRLWDFATGAENSVLRGHEEAISTVAFSPDGDRIVTASPRDGLRMWDSYSTTPVHTLREGDHRVSRLPFQYRDTRGGAPEPVWTADLDGEVLPFGETARITSDGRYAVLPGRRRKLRGEYTVDVWDTRSHVLVHALSGHTDTVTAVAVSLDGERFASGSDDKAVRVWDLRSGELLATFEDHQESISAIEFDPSGERLAAGSSDGRVTIYRLRTGHTISGQDRHTGAVNVITWSSDGTTLATGGADDVIRLWGTATGFALDTLYGHKDAVTCLAFAPDGSRLFSGSRDQTVRVWDPELGLALVSLSEPALPVQSIHLTAGGTRLVSVEVGRRPVVRVWDSDLEEARGMWRARETVRAARVLVERLCEECETAALVMRRIEQDASLDPKVKAVAMIMASALEHSDDSSR